MLDFKKDDVVGGLHFVLLVKLKKAQFVKSLKGANGGYLFSGDIDKISYYDMVKIFEGEIKLLPCYSSDNCCAVSDTCLSKNYWCGLQNDMVKMLKACTLSDLIKKYEVQGLSMPVCEISIYG